MRRTYRALYRLGLTPWDSDDVPVHLSAAVEGPTSLPPGHAVDLGCGTGRQARYLADHGWSVTAVDYLSQVVETARRQDPDGRVRWLRADATRLTEVDPSGRLAGTVTLILDNGCLHGIPERYRAGWAATVHALAAAGCLLLVRAAPRRHHGAGPGGIGLRGVGPHGIGPRGIDPEELGALLGTDWRTESLPGSDWYRSIRMPRADRPAG